MTGWIVKIANSFSRLGTGFVVFAVLTAGGCASQGPVLPDLEITESEYQLGNGDKLLVTVYGQPQLTGEHAVNGAGNISLPLIGAVSAGGGTAAELEARIVDKLKPQYLNDPRVSVQVLSFRPFYIVGEVKNPGSYNYVDGMVIMNAVALAGGFTYRAREDQFHIKRSIDPDRHRRAADPDAPVMPGDIVIVRERYF